MLKIVCNNNGGIEDLKYTFIFISDKAEKESNLDHLIFQEKFIS